MNPHDRRAFLFDIRFLEPEKFKLAWNTIQHLMNEKERNAIEQGT
jgi:hypothetical protein